MIMSHHKFCPDKQQYNIANSFPVYVLEIAVVEKFMNISNMVHEPGICT